MTFIRKYRVFPVIFSVFYLHIMLEVLNWYTALQAPGDGQGLFAGAVMAAGAAWFKFYVESGNEKHE